MTEEIRVKSDHAQDPSTPAEADPPAENLSWSERLRRTIWGLGQQFDRASEPRGESLSSASGSPLLDRGAVAELRRLDPRSPASGTEAAFWRLAVDRLEPTWVDPRDDDSIRRWMAILRGMALTAGLHVGGSSAGRALAEAGVSEARLTKLLRSSGDVLFDELRSAAHLVKSKGERLDWSHFAELVLTEGRDRGEHVRRRIAADYYRSQRQRARGGADS